MTDLHAGIREIVTSVWDTVLSLPVDPAPGAPDPSLPTVTCVVQVEGAWEGAVVLRCPEALAVLLTAAMFGGDGEPAPEDVQDALGEIANIVAGNVKALLPPPCRITLPVVARGRDVDVRMPGTEPLAEESFGCQGHAFVVTVVEQSGVA